ncbi:hypothetical protein RS130_09310 [Paraglaciecola aquimarina]|uniref:Uncharacterized protein n=1 Tax=Paraglaciecola aquimarina TaxID=1235557 RepID=A0ABU3SVS0_9ALTE|nr:hypothetical protein [Paraglaciecola aquimarina]MDU0354106.1 hypothetical protein [Paraglaciecola aquimarina]
MKLLHSKRINLLFILILQIFSVNALSFDMQEQWPMFGGPHGNGQVTTSNTIKNEWSVRTGKNIKWQVELPAGGQSGITVWQDQVLFTINKPLDTATFSQISDNIANKKQIFEQAFQSTVAKLIADGDQQLGTLQQQAQQAAQVWQNFYNKENNKT